MTEENDMNKVGASLSPHRRTWELIPWLVNGTASLDERRSVQPHLDECHDCREELEFQLQLYTAMRNDSLSETDPQPALQDLWARIDAEPGLPTTHPRRHFAPRLMHALIAAVIIEAIGLTALGGALWGRNEIAPTAPLYRTLSLPTSGVQGASIRAVLAPTLTLNELQALLKKSQLQIVDGPSDAGVYSLAQISPNTDRAQALAQLRADPAVRFAEPVDVIPRDQVNVP